MKFHIMTIAAFIAAMINFSPVYGWSYPGSGSIALGGVGPGDVISSFDARTLSMGGSSMAAAHGIAGVFYNPALLSLRQRRGVMVGGYGNFSSQVVTGGDKYRSASSNYNIPLVGAMLPMGNLRLALGYSKLFDMAYTSENKTYTLGKPNTLKIENKGGPGRMILGASSKLFGKLNAGLSMNMIMGGSEGSVSEIKHEVSRISLDTDRDLSGMFLQLGGVYSLKRDLAHIGLTFAPSYTMTDSWKGKATTSYWSSSKEEWGSPVEAEAKGKAELTMPSVLGLGIQYNFLGLDRTLITADIQRTDWSSFRYEEKDASAAGYAD